MPKEKKYHSSERLLEDELLTAEQVGEFLKLTPEAVYQGCGLAKKLHPVRAGKRYTRWSRNELQAVIAEAVRFAQEADSLVQQTRVYPPRREPKRKPFSREELDEIRKSVRGK